MDCEMIQMMTSLMQTPDMSADEFGLDAMEDVGVGGHFFGTEHTLSRYKTEFYEPILSDWQNQENWQLAGSMTATERATGIWQDVLKTYEAPAIDPPSKTNWPPIWHAVKKP